MRYFRSPTHVFGLGTVLAGVTASMLGIVDQMAAQQPARPAADQRQGEPSLPRPVVDTHHLMQLFNRPVYGYLKESVSAQPSDAKGWQTIQERGLQVAEVANLVAIRAEGNTIPQWRGVAADLQLAGVGLAEAAKAQDWTATQDAYGNIVQQCNRCHQAAAPDEAPQIRP